MAEKNDKVSKPQERVVTVQPQIPTEVKTLVEWTAPGRPFKKRTKNYYASSILLAFLFCVIAAFFHEYMLVLVIISFVFVAFALNTIPPKDFHYKISSEGITIEDHFYLWQELYDFYFKKRFSNIEVLHVRTKAFLPGEITLTLDNTDQDRIKTILLRYLPYREVITPTFIEKSGEWLNKNFPLEEPLPAKKSS